MSAFILTEFRHWTTQYVQSNFNLQAIHFVRVSVTGKNFTKLQEQMHRNLLGFNQTELIPS